MKQPALFIVLMTALVALLTASCAKELENVKPWERGDLSGNLMRPDLNSMEKFDRNHIFFSKEASLGGFSTGGGGCGCN